MNVNIMTEAEAISDEIIGYRRTIHSYAEVGFELYQTLPFVEKTLRSFGYETKRVGKAGIVCEAGEGRPIILLRADMDALPMPDESGLPFAATNGNSHSCGHDAHTAMLLGAAKILKENENQLRGTVRFMFQPAEETCSGAHDMIQNGVLENVQSAFALHVEAGDDYKRAGRIQCCYGIVGTSIDVYTIHILGENAHGSTPYLGVDAISIAAHVVNALQQIIDKEVPSWSNDLILVGTIHGGSAPNIVANSVTMEVSVRTEKPNEQKFLGKRICEVAEGVAKAFRGSVQIIHNKTCPPQINNDALAKQFCEYLHEFLPDDRIQEDRDLACGSEDFAFISDSVPGAFFYLFVGNAEEGCPTSLHTTTFNMVESSLCVGTAAHAYIAMRYLEDQAKGKQ